jgi:DNA-binding SARP family transcriptional activator/Tfp pilus assembly protein PilF
LRFRILGPVEVGNGAAWVSIAAPRHRAMLAYLLLHANRVVTIDALIDALWPEPPPPTARAQVHVAMSKLRRELRALGMADVIHTEPSGYRLHLDPGDLDAEVFAGEAATARRANDRGDHHDAAQRLRAALDLWRGEALAGVASPFARAARLELSEARLTAQEQLGEAELALGEFDALIPRLGRLVDEHPLRERLVAQLMRALSAAGRAGEALDRYGQVREVLAEQLGADPGPELQRLHLTILRGETVSVPIGQSSDAAAPRQLPREIPGFAGRDLQLKALTEIAGTEGGVAVITGMAGIGKTTLAVRWAHRHAERFPDGQLYLNLRGFDPDEPRMDPAEALRSLLIALGVPTTQVPSTLDDQVNAYRSRLADRRMLIVLDNAREAAQARPLLPGSASCFVIVTSRDQLSGLVTAHGARVLPLDLLDPVDARNLLAQRLGMERIEAEPLAVERIISRCAGLPLALAIVAARSATRHRFTLEQIAQGLSSSGDDLDAFGDGDQATDIRSVFSWSYRMVAVAQGRLFRRLSLHPGPDLAVSAAASLAGIPVAQAHRLLDQLASGHLVSEVGPGRFALHDLLRAYAAELAQVNDSPAERDAALGRLFDHYTHTAHAAAMLLEPYRHSVALDPPEPGVVPEPLGDFESATGWFLREHPNLLAVIRRASALADRRVGAMAWALSDHLQRRGDWHDQALVHRLSLEAAQRRNDQPAQARAHRLLGRALTLLEEHAEAVEHYEAALGICQAIGDLVGQAHTHLNLGNTAEALGHHADAHDHARRALEVFQRAGNKDGQARSLNAIGWFCALLGEYEEALWHCRQALEMLIELDDLTGQGNTLHSLGYVHQQLGQYDQALASYETGGRIFRGQGDRINEGIMLHSTGDTHYAAGDPHAAGRAWRAALALLEETASPEAEAVRAKLSGVR